MLILRSKRVDILLSLTALTEKLRLGATQIKGSEADRRDRENKFRDTISSEQRCHVPPKYTQLHSSFFNKCSFVSLGRGRERTSHSPDFPRLTAPKPTAPGLAPHLLAAEPFVYSL